ncbi:type III-A CRISPR-associated protein Cas10/Csm1 [Clostridium sp. D2Q-14]|uniref:type III-A CRISPR-associated protein Cas10/Csm1 n=1 Tax=Anaeromonas gelatinilytica TaxID=2683194 RepID=UPI00193B0CEB|nr:type III-A CRISPR-associated protein Cas10/Csm1 [Anaeromonas gelatinilytica]MBS4534147.1 type III-A CRISPR-associated protein Cas10/Csm1 [Anaeromonas gelatinilytica]
MNNTNIYIYSILRHLESIIDKKAIHDTFISRKIIEMKGNSDAKGIYNLAIKLFDKENLKKGNQLVSIFSQLFDEKKDYYYNFNPLELNSIMPKKNLKYEEDKYNQLIREFNQGLGKVNDELQLYYILEKYLWCIPGYLTGEDTSLFDEVKVIAALSICINQQIDENNEQKFLLINGDISGIQDFIFNIPSKGASKSLKGRSVYINLLSEIVSKFIIDRFELKEANIIFNGGGNFLILASESKKQEFYEIRKEISKLLNKYHKGNIYIALEEIEVGIDDLKEFNISWQRLRDKTNLNKKSKWSELDIEENFEEVFGPFDEGSIEREACSLCGLTHGGNQVDISEDEEISLCDICKSYIDLTDNLKDAKFYIIDNRKTRDINNGYDGIFNELGYSVKFSNKISNNIIEKEVYLLNGTNFLNEKLSGFKFGSYTLPCENGQIINFKRLSGKSTGDEKLGYLKLDVDNLGSIFSVGINENRTIAKVTYLSRMVSMYFEGYINHLIKENEWDKYIYVVFSGGDDTFIVGSWNYVLKFSKKFRDDFSKYVCNNEKLSFSAGISIFRYDYPIIRSSDMVEEQLEEAKNFKYNFEYIPSKNRFSLLREIFTWDEFEKISEIEDLLLKIVDRESKMSDRRNGHAILYKVQKSTLGFKNLLKDSTKGNFNKIKFWKLAYYLREVKRKDDEDNNNYAEELIDTYRNILIENVLKRDESEKIRNIMMIPVAVKLAQLQTRNSREER